jgi:hypothetical protein
MLLKKHNEDDFFVVLWKNYTIFAALFLKEKLEIGLRDYRVADVINIVRAINIEVLFSLVYLLKRAIIGSDNCNVSIKKILYFLYPRRHLWEN